MEIGVQIVSLAIVVTISINFFINKKLPLLSTKLFAGFILLVVTNIGFEFTTLYTIYNIETISPFVNRLCHQFFIGSLNFAMFLLYLYVDMKARQQKRYTPLQLCIRCIPALVSVVTIIFARLSYHIGDDGRYSYGPMATTVFISLFVYVALTIFILFRKKEFFELTERRTLVIGIAVWVTIGIIQLVKPSSLLSSMGLALMAMFVYISKENPRVYTDYEVKHTLNQHAYEVVLQEWFQSGREFYITVITITNATLLRNTYGNQLNNDIQGAMAELLTQRLKTNVYNTGKKSIGILSSTDVTDDKLNEELLRVCHSINEVADLQITAIKCPLYVQNSSDAQDLINFVNKKSIAQTQGGNIKIDQTISESFQYSRLVERIVQKAIREDGLEVYYQPIYNTEKRTFASSEALVRLKDTQTAGYISPEIFIPIAENRNMIGELGNIVFKKVCRFYSENRLKDKGVEYVEVNLSGKQIINSMLPQCLLECAEKYGVETSCINLEITETAAVEARELLMGNMNKLRESGFTFSMDDFGTGYSNLSEMADTDFDLVKLDKSLIWPCFMENPQKPQVILNSCIQMIHNLGKHIVAEGVETKEQADYLTQKKVTYLQGYYFSKPLCENDYLNFIISHQK